MRVSTWRIAWRNLGRNKRRTFLALLAIAVGQFALLATNGLMHGYADNIRLAITGPMIGHVQIHEPDWREERAMDLTIRDVDKVLEVVRADDEVKNAGARIYAPVLAAPERDAFGAVVLGVEVDVESTEYGLLSGLDQPLRQGEVLIGNRLARRMKAKPGQEIAIIGQAVDGSIANDLYTIKDIVSSPADIVNQSGVVMRLDDAQQLFYMPGEAHEIVIRAKTSGISGELTHRLAEQPALRGLEVADWKTIVPELVLVVEMADYMGYFVLILVFIAAIAGIANTFMMATFERIHEFGMLLALGTRPVRLVSLILVEATLLGILGVIVGTMLGGVFVAITHQTGIDMASWGGPEASDIAYQGLNLPLEIHPRLTIVDPLVGLVAVIITALTAAAWPASLAARLEPMEAMRA